MSLKHYLVAVIAAASLAACAADDRREYTLQGQILSVTADRMEANIKHEEIPGFMGAMTMPYRVRDAQELANLQPGDLITSKLVIVTNDAYLTEVRKVGTAPLEKAPDAGPSASSGFELIAPGTTVPNAAFVDQDGKAREFASFRPATTVLTFIYTTCPMPTFCPLMDRHFATIQTAIKADASLKNVHLVSVSFDPTTDTPAVLKKHAAALGADPARWTFVTGNRDDVDQFAMRFGVSLARDLTDPANITHNLRTAIIDGNGALVKAYTGNDWTPEQVVTDLRQLGQ